MKTTATIKSENGRIETRLETNDSSKAIQIMPKANGQGSSVNGGELLLLALATCFCNDLYREAAKRNMVIHQVEVIASAEFGAEGEPGFNFTYKSNVLADASDEEIQSLIQHTDKVAEIHNTLRKGANITIC